MKNEIKHHLPPGLLMAYSAGTLSEAESLLVATHISMCDTCRAELESFDALGGAVLDMSPATDVTMSSGAFEATLARIAASQAPASVRSNQGTASDVPAPLKDYVGSRLSDVKWRSLGMGVKQSVLETSSAATARLLHIPAGAAMPSHSHNGLEMTLVLRGAYRDETAYFGPGDVEIADDSVEHKPVADIYEDCICLTVTDAPLAFRDLLPRLAQPFLRI